MVVSIKTIKCSHCSLIVAQSSQLRAATATATATAAATATLTENSYVRVAYIEILKLCMSVWMLIDFNMPQLNLICTQNNLRHARQWRKIKCIFKFA